MKKKTASLKITLMVALVAIALVGGLAVAGSAPAGTSSTTSPMTVQINNESHADPATMATTTTIASTPTVAGGLIVDGPSRRECLAPSVNGNGLGVLQSAITNFDEITGTSVSCISTYLSGAPTWSSWEHPWVADAKFGYGAWVAEAPQRRELVLQVDLIPTSLKDIVDPLSWEESCAAGKFNSHATELGKSLVAAGLQNSVIRLGAEMNGTWETDFVGRTPVEQQQWVRCFDNEVIGLRLAIGEHFLIDWNPNACKYNLSFSRLYPGNSYVDMMGLDLFDVACIAPRTPYSFAQLANEPTGLSSFEAFATAHKKPMSLPEWALSTIPSGDDPQYIAGIGSTFDSRDFAFESYFDGAGGGSKALPLGPRTPLSIQAFQKWFGSGVKP